MDLNELLLKCCEAFQELAEGIREGRIDDPSVRMPMGDDYDDVAPRMFVRDSNAFPGRKFYYMSDLDPDDGSFYGGREIGIPSHLAIRVSEDQNRLLPVQSGLFDDRGM